MVVLAETCTKLEMCGVIQFLAAKGYRVTNTYCRIKTVDGDMLF
jgi:hypothetical protein